MDLEKVCYGCFRGKSGDTPVCPYCGFSVDEEQPFLALPMGTVLRGRYLMGRVLGVGGFGITYLGYDLVLEIKVAVKEYMPSGLAIRHTDRYRVVQTGLRKEDYETGLERFLGEARILAKLQGTSNIVSVQDYFKENNTAYFVMEYVDGMSLKAYLASQGGKIPYDQALAILQPIMEALIRVHGLGLTHRDISPDNVSITSGGESKLLDFGAARFSSTDEKSVSVILKHGFAPEEQYSSHGIQGPWTDVYAMSATLYRCITGELPPDSIQRLRQDTLKRPSQLGILLPEKLEEAIIKAMAVKAEDRFPSMVAFLQAATGRDGRSVSSDVGEGREREALGNRGTQVKFSKKHLALKIAALAVCGTIIGIGILKLFSGIGVLTDAKTSEPLASASKSGSSKAEGSEAESSEAEPSETEPNGNTQTDLNDYSNEYLNLFMKIPSDFEETEPGSAVFTSADGSCSLQIGFYTYWLGFPVYSLADVELNAEKYVQYFIGVLQSSDITDYKILSEDYRQIGERNSYQVLFEAAESSGSAMRFLAVFIDGQNGFGCYNLIASYPQEDEDMQEKILSSVESFQCMGPAGTDYVLFSDEKLSFKFMYAKEEITSDFEIENNILTSISMKGSDYFILTVNEVPLVGTETVYEVLGQFTEELDTMYPEIEQLGEQKIVKSGGMEWAVQNYVNESEGSAVYMSYSISIWQDQAYLIICSSSQEAQLDDNGLKKDIMGSLRPAT